MINIYVAPPTIWQYIIYKTHGEDMRLERVLEQLKIAEDILKSQLKTGVTKGSTLAALQHVTASTKEIESIRGAYMLVTKEVKRTL